jgi:putative acetyltransferase
MEHALCYPPHPAFDRICESFTAAFRRNGADPEIGRKVSEMFRQAGLADVGTEARAPLYPPGHTRRTIRADLVRSMRPRVLELGVASEAELDELDAAVRTHLADPRTITISGLLFLTWGRKPGLLPVRRRARSAAGGYICRVDVTIRGYEPRDAAGLADVFFRSVRQVALSAYTAEQVRAWAPEPRTAEWAHGEATDGRLVLVAANEDDRPVAYIDLEPNGHIDRLFCAPEAAGQGIASRLYDAVEAAAREQGIRSLFTEASELARRVFERKGFAVVQRQDLVIRGVAIHNYRMAKALD